MEAQELVYKLCGHLLGKDWYISDPVDVDTANGIIYESICRRYPAVEESPKDRYRRRHPKCKWCNHCRYVTPPAMICPSYYRCDVKDKVVNENVSRLFCSVFELRKEQKMSVSELEQAAEMFFRMCREHPELCPHDYHQTVTERVKDRYRNIHYVCSVCGHELIRTVKE